MSTTRAHLDQDMYPHLRENPVRIRAIKPQKTERFACSARDVRSAFAATAVSFVGFGHPTRSFITARWNTQYSSRPKFSGPVVASINLMNYRFSYPGISAGGISYPSISAGERTAYLYLYPVRQDLYSKEAVQQFQMDVLPMIKDWLGAEMSKPDTQYLGGRTMVIEWTGEIHKRYVLRRR